MSRLPRSLIFYVAASSIYAAVVFLAVHVVYGIELGASGFHFPDPEAPILEWYAWAWSVFRAHEAA